MWYYFLMSEKEILRNVVADSQSRELPVLWRRSLQVPTDSGKIVTLTGVRRSGKTYHLFQVMKDLEKLGVSREKMLYFNFEDERLTLTQDKLELILEVFREENSDLDLADCYFLFDEIQEVAGWEKFVLRVYETISKHVFVTGSNAKLLSSEIATYLRGRNITYEVYPLSFAEYVEILSPDLNPSRSKDKAVLIRLFDKFMHQGGFPELVKADEELRNKILQEYFSVMVMRDLIERYQISNSSTLKYFCKRVIGASGGEFSVNKIYNELKSQGYQVSKDTLYLYQDYVETIYLNRFVSKYSHSVVKSENSQKKTYVIDSGLGSSVDFKLGKDVGRLLETVVALELLKQQKQIAYQQNGFECDFVVIDKNVVTEAIQVAVSVSDAKTMGREIKGLVQTCLKNGLTEGIVITLDRDDEMEVDEVKIKMIPAWKYFRTKLG